jgi:hypothetical protein
MGKQEMLEKKTGRFHLCTRTSKIVQDLRDGGEKNQILSLMLNLDGLKG